MRDFGFSVEADQTQGQAVVFRWKKEHSRIQTLLWYGTKLSYKFLT